MVDNVKNMMIGYFKNDVKRINHAVKVCFFAGLIGAGEGLKDEELKVLEITALLHDIGIVAAEEKYGSSGPAYQEKEGPPVARKLLSGTGLKEAQIRRICELIAHHHSYGALEGVDFYALIEADFLVNAFEDDMPQKAMRRFREKYFKTDTGKMLLQTMFGV